VGTAGQSGAVDGRIARGLSVGALSPTFALVLLLVAAETLFLVNLQHPRQMFFDETHYVPAARDLLHGIRYGNIEHPLAAKTLIGLSMLLFGDTPLGWRLMSTFFGCATLAAIFLIAQSLFRDVRVSLTAGVLALLNQMLFVQARIAMLDVYMGAFLLLALWCLTDAYGREEGVRLRLISAGALLGLSIGSKWLALPYLAAAGFSFLLLKLVSTRRAGEGPRAFLFSRTLPAWRGVSTVEGAFWIGGLSLFVYLATFWPAFFVAENALTLARLLPHQLEMYAQQTQPLAPHTYQSQWSQWPQIERPIWYLYERVEGVLRGVLLVGNPAIMWGGLVGVLACLAAGLRARDPRLLLVAGLWIFAFGIWVLIPKKIGFYYYYYLPAMFLPLALAAAFHHYCRSGLLRWLPPPFTILSAGLFAYFYPILAATPLGGDNAFLHWTWFDTWR
jgi:dolichyl-phosphate-mannose--protein O-mannosyl transferase